MCGLLLNGVGVVLLQLQCLDAPPPPLCSPRPGVWRTGRCAMCGLPLDGVGIVLLQLHGAEDSHAAGRDFAVERSG